MDGSAESQRHDGAAGYVMHELFDMLEALRGSDVLELDLQEGEVRLRLHRRPAPRDGMVEHPSIEGESPREPEVVEITAPLVGTFYRAAHPGEPPLAAEGSKVQAESVVGIIEALQVLTEVEAGCSGTVVGVLATDGQPVQYGQTLFQVATND